MIVIDNKTVSDDLPNIEFVCKLKKSKGARCVEGDAGGPLLYEEISQLEDSIDEVNIHMTRKGLEVEEAIGVFDYDMAGEFVTPPGKWPRVCFCKLYLWHCPVCRRADF